MFPKVVKFKFAKLVHPWKQLSGTLNWPLKVTLVRLIQALKVFSPINVTLDGIVALIKLSEEAKTLLPIDVTDVGISIIIIISNNSNDNNNNNNNNNIIYL